MASSACHNNKIGDPSEQSLPGKVFQVADNTKYNADGS
jgi:hypothetical protein